MVVEVLDNLMAPQSCKANIIQINDQNGVNTLNGAFGEIAAGYPFDGFAGTGAASIAGGICVVGASGGVGGAIVGRAAIAANLFSNSKVNKIAAPPAEPNKFID